MASTPSKQRSGAIGLLPALTVIIAVAIFLFTYSGIHRSRKDSFSLLKGQGVTLLETLVESADNAITANTYYWESFIARISPIAQLTFTGFHAEDALRMFEVEAQDITVQAVYKFDNRLLVTESAYNPDVPDIVEPTDLLYEAASELLSDSSLVRSLIFMPDSAAESATALYLALDSAREQGICLALSAPGLWEMESEVGIAALIQRLGSAGDVSYIFFQDLDGLIFSSLPIDSLEPIAADSFLQAAYVSDSISSRTIDFDGVETLELVAPFSSALYPDGLFRLGISLERYHAETAEFNQQMIFFGVILFLLAALAPLYFGLRRQRRELGLSLAREQSLSSSILNNMQSGVLALDDSGVILALNLRLAEMFELERAAETDSPVSSTQLAQRIPEDILTGADRGPRSGEFQCDVAGAPRYFLYSLAPVDLQRGRIGRAITIYDYTRQKELEEESARRARLAELGDLAAGVAHEIRNPLNAISLAAQRLDLEFAGQVKDDAEQFRFFTGQIKDESKRLDGIVTRLLDLTRAPKVEIESQPVAEIITDWAGFMRPEIERDKVNLVVTLDESLRAKVDRNKLRQSLGNLYRNAHEAYLAAQQRADHLEITLELRRQDDHAALIFTDNGPGISAEIADKMFTPYFTTKDNGAGLGLAISYRLISDMGGTLELDKSHTDGARFVMTLQL